MTKKNISWKNKFTKIRTMFRTIKRFNCKIAKAVNSIHNKVETMFGNKKIIFVNSTLITFQFFHLLGGKVRHILYTIYVVIRGSNLVFTPVSIIICRSHMWSCPQDFPLLSRSLLYWWCVSLHDHNSANYCHNHNHHHHNNNYHHNSHHYSRNKNTKYILVIARWCTALYYWTKYLWE